MTCEIDIDALSAPPRRAFEAETYWSRLRPHLTEFGISRVGDITGLDRLGLPVVQACRPDARSNAVTQGKGQTLAEAAVSAVLECVEMSAGEDLGNLDPWGGAISAADVDQWGPLANGADWPSDADGWLKGWDAITGAAVPIPSAVADTDFTLNAPAQAAPILRSSVGLGAGQSLAGAAWHGLLECIENDARIRFLHALPAEAEARRFDPGVLDDERAVALVARLREAGFGLATWDMTRLNGPRTVMVRLMESPALQPALPLPSEGFACRPSVANAVTSAVLEAVQARLALISGAREDMTQAVYRHLISEAELWAEWEYLAATPNRPPAPDTTCPDTAPDLAASLAERGAGPIVVLPLLRRPDIPLWVTRICAPRLIADPMRLAEGGA